MTTLTIPVNASPSTTFTCSVGGGNCSFWIRQLESGLYLDLYLNNSPILLSAKCVNNVPLIRDITTGFQGDLVFIDTQGTSDPTYDGLGERYILQWRY